MWSRGSVFAIGHALTKLLLVLVSLTTTASALEDWQPLPAGGVTRIAFGSCAKQWESQSIWQDVLEARPDLFLFVGDAISGDWHGEQPFTPTEATLRSDWQALAGKPEFIEVRRKVPFMAVWDNHDFGSHHGGAEFALKEMTHVNPLYAASPNRYRVAGPYVELNLGLLEIDWDNEPTPQVVMKALGLGGQVGYQKPLSLGELQR